jgi:hypothetical protein
MRRKLLAGFEEPRFRLHKGAASFRERLAQIATVAQAEVLLLLMQADEPGLQSLRRRTSLFACAAKLLTMRTRLR